MRLALVLVAAAGLLVVEVGGKRGKRGKRSRHPRPGAGEGPLPPPTVDANEDGWEDDTGWLPRALLQRCDLTRTTAGSLTAESFAESFAGRKPLLIEGLAEGWSAGSAWSAPELLRTHGSHLVLHEEPSHVAQFGAGDVHPDQVEVSGEKQSSLQGWLRRQRLSRGEEGGSLVCKCSSGSAFSEEPEAAAARSRQVGGHHRPVIAAGGSFCGRTAAAGCGGGGRTLI